MDSVLILHLSLHMLVTEEKKFLVNLLHDTFHTAHLDLYPRVLLNLANNKK